MSADFDEDVWDVITENKIIDLTVTTISKSELEQIRDMAIYASNQKLQKLNIVLRNMNVYFYDDTLLINDKFNVCPELVKISQALGLDIKTIDCNLKGKTYILNDKLTSLIKTIDVDYKYGECVSNSQITEQIQELILKNECVYNIDISLEEYFQQILQNDKLIIKGTQKVTSTYENGRLIKQEKQEVISNVDEINQQLKKFLLQTSQVLKVANENLRDGTAELLFSRARQMGYAVEKSQVGDKVEMVLVRYE